jgi:prevent-host-death family protein
MTSVSVTELKARLSHFLREVRLGGEVLVLDRGVPVARLVGSSAAADVDDDAAWERLLSSGTVRPPSRPWPSVEAGVAAKPHEVSAEGDDGATLAWPGAPLELDLDLAAAVDAEREDRV